MILFKRNALSKYSQSACERAFHSLSLHILFLIYPGEKSSRFIKFKKNLRLSRELSKIAVILSSLNSNPKLK